jgi:hypothetical protein
VPPDQQGFGFTNMCPSPMLTPLMPIYLRDRESGAFFKRHNEWTPTSKKALDFEERDRAIRVATELQLKNVELIVAKDDGTIILAAPLSNL